MRQLLIRKIESHGRLTGRERQALLSVNTQLRRTGPRDDIVREGERPGSLHLMIEGFACRYKILPDGRRQIMGCFLPGDLFDLQGFSEAGLDHSIGTLSAATIAVMPKCAIGRLADAGSGIRQALERAVLVESAIMRAWLVNLGQRTAYERTAHFLCETFHRMQAAGLAIGMSYELPITQHELGDILGLSAVHVNRTLQELRREGLISFVERRLTIHDLESLQNAALFHPAYLSLPESEPGDADRRAYA